MPPAYVGQPVGAEIEDQLSEQLAVMVVTARRRAARDGDRQLDTAHLLHSLLESDPAVRAFLDGTGAQVGKLLGYLVQRCIGYGLRWRDTVEDPAGVPAGEDLPGGTSCATSGGSPGRSPAATRALGLALRKARERSAPQTDGIDLLAGLAADGTCRAAEVLHSAGVDTEALSALLIVRGNRGDTPVGP